MFNRSYHLRSTKGRRGKILPKSCWPAPKFGQLVPRRPIRDPAENSSQMQLPFVLTEDELEEEFYRVFGKM